MNHNYFDNAASTPVDPRVLKEMLPFLAEACGNAHSIHSFGMRARAAVEDARDRVAAFLGAEDAEEIVFTSGATESNVWVLNAFDRLAIGPFEHPSVAQTGRCRGAEVLTTCCQVVHPPTAPCDLLSLMWVNNETGIVLDVEAASAWAPKIHTDLTQAAGKVPFSLEKVHYASISAHKLYGPKGTGALYAKGGCDLHALITGGGQEEGKRSGTLNVPGIVGLGAAAAIARDEQAHDFDRATELRAIVLEEIAPLSDVRINECAGNSPFILNVCFLGLVGESLVVELDSRGFAISAASACKSSSHGSSGVLKALGVPEEWARGAVRISFGRHNTRESARALGFALRRCVADLREMATHA